MITLPIVSNSQQLAALLLPLLLIASMLWVFKAFHQWFGHPPGYLLGFVIYWLG